MVITVVYASGLGKDSQTSRTLLAPAAQRISITASSRGPSERLETARAEFEARFFERRNISYEAILADTARKMDADSAPNTRGISLLAANGTNVGPTEGQHSAVTSGMNSTSALYLLRLAIACSDSQ